MAYQVNIIRLLMNRLDDKETITIFIQALKVTKRSMLYLQKSLIRRLQTGDIPVLLSMMLKNVTWNEFHSRGIERLGFRASGLLVFRGDYCDVQPIVLHVCKIWFRIYWRFVIINQHIMAQWNPIVLAIITISPWANGGPRATPHPHPHPPWSSVSGTILFRGPSEIILAMLPPKKLVLTTNFDHFSKWPPQNLRFPISQKLLHVGSCFLGQNLYFLGQGIRYTHYTAWQTIIMCVKGWKTWKNPRLPPIPHFIWGNLS